MKKKLVLIILFSINSYILENKEFKRKEVILDEIIVKANKSIPKIPIEIISHIKFYEKFVDTIYHLDNRAYIGYGHLILKHEKFTKITEQEATNILVKDFMVNYCIINSELNMQENKILAITMLAYNVGPYKVIKWSLWDSIKSGGDCSIWLNYCYFKKKKHKGLLKRRRFEYEYFN